MPYVQVYMKNALMQPPTGEGTSFYRCFEGIVALWEQFEKILLWALAEMENCAWIQIFQSKFCSEYVLLGLINSINIFCDMFYFPATVYPQNPKFWLFTTLKRQNSTHLKNSNFFSENFREWGIDFQYNVSHIAPDTAAFLWNTNVNTNHGVRMEYKFSAKNTNNSTAKSRMRLDLSQDTTTFRALLECGVYVFYVYIWLISNESAPRRI